MDLTGNVHPGGQRLNESTSRVRFNQNTNCSEPEAKIQVRGADIVTMQREWTESRREGKLVPDQSKGSAGSISNSDHTHQKSSSSNPASASSAVPGHSQDEVKSSKLPRCTAPSQRRQSPAPSVHSSNQLSPRWATFHAVDKRLSSSLTSPAPRQDPHPPVIIAKP